MTILQNDDTEVKSIYCKWCQKQTMWRFLYTVVDKNGLQAENWQCIECGYAVGFIMLTDKTRYSIRRNEHDDFTR